MVAASLVSRLVQHANPVRSHLYHVVWSRTSSGSSFIQISEAPLLRPGQMMQIRNHLLVQKSTRYKDFHQEQKRAVMITWCFGGKRVAITGSCNNWKTIEPLHSLGKDFIIMKMLPFSVYHYQFIVDELKRYAPNLPCKFDESGNAYNILDLQETSSKPAS